MKGAASLKLFKRLITMGTGIESSTSNIFQTLPANKPLFDPLLMDLLPKNDNNIYQQRLEQIIYRLKTSNNFNKAAKEVWYMK